MAIFNEFFFNSEYFHILFSQPVGLWVPTQPPCHYGWGGTHHGVQSVIMCLQPHLKIKTGKFYHFQI